MTLYHSTKGFEMDRVFIEWGNLERTEALESLVYEKAEKFFKIHSKATKMIVTFKIINPITSAGPATQKVTMELRLPQKQDIRASKEGTDAYRLVHDAEKALMAQVR